MDFPTTVNLYLSFISTVVAIISIVTAILTLRQNSTMIENATRPYVSIYGQSINTGIPVFYVVIKNTGASPAIMKRFSVTPDVHECYKVDKSRDFLTDMNIGILPAGQSRICAMDYNKLPDLLEFEFEYSSLDGKKVYSGKFKTNVKAGSSMLTSKSAARSDLSTDIHAIA